MKYQPFSNPANIEKMVQTIEVLHEQLTLEVTLPQWLEAVYQNEPEWVKYVSSRSVNKREVCLYWDTKVERRFIDRVWRNLLRDHGYFNKLTAAFFNWYRTFEQLTDRYYRLGRSFFAAQTREQLTQLFHEYCQACARALAGYYIVYDLALLLPPRVEQKLKRLGIKNASDVVARLCSRGITSMVMAEKLSFWKRVAMLQATRSQPKREQIIFDHWYRFGNCLYAHQTNKRYTLEEYRQKFADHLERQPQPEIRNLRRWLAQDLAEIRPILRRLRSYPTVRQHVQWMRQAMQYRNHESLYIENFFANAASFFDELAARLGVTRHDLWWLGKEEILSRLSGHDVTRITSARKRRGFTIKQEGRRIIVRTGVRKEDRHERSVTPNQELKGSAAFAGHVRGTVHVILNAVHQGKYFHSGDVLVTSMTTPEFVPLMKRAAAIVTDEGGLLCHAAIVSRELKKPCVIGTKIATQVLKDGDLVEVDAERGIVRKLKP